MACDKVFYIFALVLLHISYSESTMTECEKIYLPKCGRGFVSEWKKRDANMTPKQKLAIYCNSFQVCFFLVSFLLNACKGVFLTEVVKPYICKLLYHIHWIPDLWNYHIIFIFLLPISMQTSLHWFFRCPSSIAVEKFYSSSHGSDSLV